MRKFKTPVSLKNFLAIWLIIALFSNCQKEFENKDEPDKEETISTGDTIADLIRKVVLKDGSFDNIIDKCSEISINYPYSINIKDERIDITSLEDIETIKLEYFELRNAIQINYPITISYSDYSESVLTKHGELRKIQNQYNATNTDDDIECVDFVYPVEVNLYNTQYQKHDLIITKDDKELHNAFSNITDLIIEINYPVHISTTGKDTLPIYDNVELENEITNTLGSCEENDDVEFGDEDYPLKDLIIASEWKVILYMDTVNQTPTYTAYTFNFRKDNTIQVYSETDTLHGAWTLETEESPKTLELLFEADENPLTRLNNKWIINNTSPTIIEMKKENNKRLILSNTE